MRSDLQDWRLHDGTGSRYRYRSIHSRSIGCFKAIKVCTARKPSLRHSRSPQFKVMSNPRRAPISPTWNPSTRGLRYVWPRTVRDPDPAPRSRDPQHGHTRMHPRERLHGLALRMCQCTDPCYITGSRDLSIHRSLLHILNFPPSTDT